MIDLSGHIDAIKSTCNSNNVRSLFIFGSATSANFNSKSDVDLIVDIKDTDPISYTDHYFNLKFSLSKILSKEIDLLEYRKISNPLLKSEIDRTKQLIYEG